MEPRTDGCAELAHLTGPRSPRRLRHPQVTSQNECPVRFVGEVDEHCAKLALCYSAYAFGANDIANATGVYVTVTDMVMGGPPDGRVMFILAVFGSVGVVIGGFWLGPIVIETVAFNIIRLNVASATAAEITNALVVHLFVTVPYLVMGYGLPISTSLANIGALVGVGFSSYGSTGINKKTVGTLILFWVMSVGVTALITFTLYTLLLPITGPLLSPMAG
ncbi:hypothetical protein E4H04_12060 [Candidatus Bathyarchaeota archaeon]|nr:MAG: hypothetical protein E4H04_12060 [Candidatus Bathyarchaeota archaeon]